MDGAEWRARGECPREGCEGTRWEHDVENEVVCDSCYTVLSERHERATRDLTEDGTQGPAAPRHEVPGEDMPLSRRETKPLFGGYTRAFYSFVTDKEYALDTYDEVTDGLWTPHLRS